MSTDLTFLTNEEGRSLLDRFKVLLKNNQYFDALVGYFRSSGFYPLIKSLESTKKIRILVGIGLDKQTLEHVTSLDQIEMTYSHKEIREGFSNQTVHELTKAEDSYEVEEGVRIFKEWIRNKKIEIKAYPSENMHAKLYIITFPKGDRDIGRVITGSSNFSRSGLQDNLEFNVELKGRADYDFALAKFNELWKHAVGVEDMYLETIDHKTWLNDSITPYEMYLKFLYEYFQEKINLDQHEAINKYVPAGFLDLAYQKEAVLDAKNKLEAYVLSFDAENNNALVEIFKANVDGYQKWYYQIHVEADTLQYLYTHEVEMTWEEYTNDEYQF